MSSKLTQLKEYSNPEFVSWKAQQMVCRPMWVNVGLQSNDLRAVANHRRHDICFLLIVLLDALSAQGILEIRIRHQHTSLPESMLMKEYLLPSLPTGPRCSWLVVLVYTSLVSLVC
jgi:tRNA G26 N,N-dimethylase Trm1